MVKFIKFCYKLEDINVEFLSITDNIFELFCEDLKK